MAGIDTGTYTSDRSIKTNFPNSYGTGSSNGQSGQDIYAAPTAGAFNSRTFDALLRGAGINTLNPYGTGGVWASQQEAPMYWLMRARMALAPSQYGQENDPNAVGSYFDGGHGLAGQNGGFNFLSNPNAGSGAITELLNGQQLNNFNQVLNGNYNMAKDPSMMLLNEWNQNPQEMTQALSNLATSGMAGDAANAMSNYMSNVIQQVLSDPQALQGSNPVAAVARKFGLVQ